MKRSRFAVLTLAVSLLAACSSSEYRAPVTNRGEPPKKSVAVLASAQAREVTREDETQPEIYIVKKGDTLYSIAFNFGLDHQQLAESNGIKDAAVIHVGQQIRLYANNAANNMVGTIQPVTVDSKPLQPAVPFIKDQPKVVKYAYSDSAAAQIDKVQEPAQTHNALVGKPKVETPIQTVKPPTATTVTEGAVGEALQWSMPTQGKVISEFSEANNKGIDIAGKLNQPILASAPGKVVYSGSGLRGYGNLVIIKHNKAYLSAYAHNSQILVKEGQAVTRGQEIAKMGKSDADQVKLHFEVRYFGKPVDPQKFLPPSQS